MAFNGAGVFVRLYNWGVDKLNGIPITASRMDAEMNGMATGLSTCITKDGQTTISANIPMSSHKFTGLSVGNARTDSITVGQVQDGQFTYLGLTTGIADQYNASPAPAVTAYVESMQYTVKINATNLTATPYLQLSAIATPSSTGVIKKLDASKAEIAVEASDMIANGLYDFQRNSANNAWILLNPEKSYNQYLTLDSNALNNLGLATSVGSNALTISLKTKAGTDPTVASPVKISFRSSTAATGTYNTYNVTNTLSLVVSSGSTLGTANGVAATLYVYALDNAGTVELGISFNMFRDDSIQSSTAEGGSGGADSGTVLYSTTARSNVPVRLIATINITEATAGTWVSTPTTITVNPIGNLASGFANVKGDNGYTYLPNGDIFQWGEYSFTGVHASTYSPNFPLTFPNSVSQVIGYVTNTVTTGTTLVSCPLTADTTSGFTFQYGTANGAGYNTTLKYWAIGN